MCRIGIPSQNQHYLYFSFQSEGDPSTLSPLSRHIRGVVEVGGSKEQDRILKIKAELDCYQHNYSSRYRGGESDLRNINHMFRDSRLSRRSSLSKSMTMSNKNPIGKTTSLEEFIGHPETLINRACSVSGIKRSRSSSSNRTSKLGKLVEENARRKNSFF